MNVLDFTNNVDGLTNDFTAGITDERTFKSGIMDLLIKVAAPRLDGTKENNSQIKSVEREIIENSFRQSDSDNGAFMTTGCITDLLYEKTGIRFTVKQIARSMTELKFDRVSHRRPYFRVPCYGYWLVVIA